MIGAKLYTRKKRTLFFLLTHSILFAYGALIAMRAVAAGENLPNTSGFLMIFGAGMFIMTFIKGRKPQVSVHDEYLAVSQSATPLIVRYRNMVRVSRPDSNRLLVTLNEEGGRKEVPVYVRELEKSDIDRLEEFLKQRIRRKE